MDVEVFTSVPQAWATCSPIQTYETEYIYTGVSRIDTHAKKIQTLKVLDSGYIRFDERDFQGGVIPRVYATERVRVTVYAKVPRVWKEDLSPTEVYFYCQCGSRTSRKT